MLRVYNCLTTAHDLGQVGLAIVICALASFTGVSLLHHVRSSCGRMRLAWLAVSATSTGFGIWATHFIAMFAFSPGLPAAYAIDLTLASLVAAILFTGIGLAVALVPGNPACGWIGGGIVGCGIAAMHYTGMAAFEVQGRLAWDPALVAASIVLGCLMGSIALPVCLRRSTLKRKVAGGLLLTMAICGLHSTAMGAVSIVPDPTVEFSAAVLPVGWLAGVLALASCIIVVVALAGVVIDTRERTRTVLKGLANAAVEGLVISDGETIVTVNDAFAALIGSSPDAAAGSQLRQFLPDEAAQRRLLNRPNQAVESDLRHVDGSLIAVELIMRVVDFAGQERRAIAVRDLRARKEAEQHICFLAHHDPLTGLPNRASFNAQLDREIEAVKRLGGRLAVLCLDLDRFKDVNDLFGHAAGDEMLQAVARRLSGLLGQRQTLARLGGDELAIIVPDLSSTRAAGRLAETILEALGDTGPGCGPAALVSTSIGIALYPDDAHDRHTLLTHADTALYRAKHEGRGTYRFFEPKAGTGCRERRLIEHDLRHAVARGELRLVYQPQRDVGSGCIVGFEALLCWHHPVRGPISPADFIPVAEESGVILQIGAWVLRAACTEAAAWPVPLSIAVNVSTVQIYNAGFGNLVHEILLETGLPASRLELEITETALVRDLDCALATLRRIKALGVRIAMDDFGTGYSSLSNLRSFPFDRIKIDRSFVKSVNTNRQAAAIVQAILGLGRALRLPVLAEGVETAAEMEFLAAEGCDEVQGKLAGAPTEVAELHGLLSGGIERGSTVVAALPLSQAS